MASSSSSSSSESEDDNVIVLDTGSGYIKAGIAGDDMPSVMFPAVLGRARNGSGPSFVGEDAVSQRESLTLRHPVRNGMVNDWSDMEVLLDHTYSLLGKKASDQPLLMTEAPLNPKDNREKMAEILFQKMNVPGLYFALQAVLSLYSSGRTTGMVFDSGEGVSHSIAIYEGYAPQHAIHRLDLAGQDLTSYLMSLLGAKGIPNLTTTAGMEIVRDIKETHCFVALDFDYEKAHPSPPSAYTLPDGRVIDLGLERAMCPEALFNPELVNMEAMGVHKLVHDSVSRMDVDTRRDLWASIVVTGGSTLFPNFPERLQTELLRLAPEAGKVKVIAPPDRRYAVWMGGSILGSLSTFQTSMLIGKKEYEEEGPRILHDLRVKL